MTNARRAVVICAAMAIVPLAAIAIFRGGGAPPPPDPEPEMRPVAPLPAIAPTEPSVLPEIRRLPVTARRAATAPADEVHSQAQEQDFPLAPREARGDQQPLSGPAAVEQSARVEMMRSLGRAMGAPQPADR